MLVHTANNRTHFARPPRGANFGTLITTQTSSRRARRKFSEILAPLIPARRFVVDVFPGYSCTRNWHWPDKRKGRGVYTSTIRYRKSTPRPARTGPHNFALRQTGIVLLPQTTVWSRAGVHGSAQIVSAREKQPYAGHRCYICVQSAPPGPRWTIRHSRPAADSLTNVELTSDGEV